MSVGVAVLVFLACLIATLVSSEVLVLPSLFVIVLVSH